MEQKQEKIDWRGDEEVKETELNRNNTSFDTSVRKLFKEIKDEDSRLRYFQNIVLNYVKYIKPVNGPRGLLIAADPGMGKTRLAVAIQMYLMKRRGHREETNQCYLITPKSLHENYKKTLENYSGGNTEKIHMDYISLNANNFGKKISEINLDKSVVIFDEAHKFASMVVNGSVPAVNLYMRLKNERRVHIFFLTGTPITSRIFELAVYFNILAGYALFPENEEDFNRSFANGRNLDKLQDRIRGMSSFAHIDTSSDDFPKLEPIQVVKCMLTEGEYSHYKIAEELEKRETASKAFKRAGQGGNRLAFSGSTKLSSTYRVKTRQLGHCQAKIDFIVKYILDHPNELISVYSQFINNYGIELLNKALEATGIYKKYYADKVDDDEVKDKNIIEAEPEPEIQEEEDIKAIVDENSGSNESAKQKYFINMTSEYDSEMRTKMQNEFNKPENKNGALIHVVFISAATTVGLNFKNVRHAIMMESHFLGITQEQYFGRFIRFGCQNDFPPEDRRLTRIVLLAELPFQQGDSEFPPGSVKKESSDEQLFDRSMIELANIKKTLAAIERVDIECMAGIRESTECRICSPTNEILFTKNFYEDIQQTSRCKPIDEGDEVEVEQIIIDDKTYYFDASKDNIAVFSFDSDLGGYIEISDNTSEYKMVVDHIKK